MVNTSLLYEKINDMGLKISYIASNIGLSRAGFYKKVNNISDFKSSEITKLSALLQLSEEDIKSIFLFNV